METKEYLTSYYNEYDENARLTSRHGDDRMYKLYIKYHLAVCERQDMTGCSHHTLDIFRKE